MPPTDQIALAAFVEPEANSFAHGTFRGEGWLVEDRLSLSRQRTVRRPEEDHGGRRLARESETACSAKSTTHVRTCTSMRRQGPLRCR